MLKFRFTKTIVALLVATAVASLPTVASAAPAVPMVAQPNSTYTSAVTQAVTPAGLAVPVASVITPKLLANLPLDAPTGCVVSGGLGQRCTLGNVKAKRRFVVFGDSHAAAWMPTLDYFGRHHTWAITPVIHTGCTLGVATAPTSSSGNPVCAKWWPKVIPRLKALRPAFMIVAQYYDPRIPTEQMYAGLHKELTAFNKVVPRVIVMEDDPRHPLIDPVQCLGQSGATIGTCTQTYQTELNTEHQTIEHMVGQSHDRYMHTKKWFCSGGECPPIIGHTIVYRDTEHMTITYSRTIAPDVSKDLFQQFHPK
jgi:hypothetical protein